MEFSSYLLSRDAAAQNKSAVFLAEGGGISMNALLAGHYSRLAADQGNAVAQYNYAVMLAMGKNTAMNKSLAAHYYTLAADQGFDFAQYNYAYQG
jgi:TPR repeat protein